MRIWFQDYRDPLETRTMRRLLIGTGIALGGTLVLFVLNQSKIDLKGWWWAPVATISLVGLYGIVMLAEGLYLSMQWIGVIDSKDMRPPPMEQVDEGESAALQGIPLAAEDEPMPRKRVVMKTQPKDDDATVDEDAEA